LFGEACAVTSQDDAHFTLDLNAVQIEPHCLHEKQLLASLATKFKAESEQNKYNEQLCVAKGMLHPELISHDMLDTLPAQKKHILYECLGRMRPYPDPLTLQPWPLYCQYNRMRPSQPVQPKCLGCGPIVRNSAIKEICTFDTFGARDIQNKV
jgi:hypothetical protein